VTGLAELLMLSGSRGGCDKVSAVLDNIVYCTPVSRLLRHDYFEKFLRFQLL